MKTLTIKKSKVGYLFLWVCLLGLLFARYVLYIDFPRPILLVFFTLLVMKGDKEDILGLSACCIPLHTSMNAHYAILVCIIAYLVKYGKQMKFGVGFLPLIFLWAWELIHCFVYNASVKEGFAFVLPCIMTLIVMYSQVEDVRYEKIMRTLAGCTLFMCFIVICKLFLSSGSLQGIFLNMNRLGLNEEGKSMDTGAYFNPNALGYFCLLSTIGLLQAYMSGKGKKSDLIMVFLLILFGGLTLSRTFMVCFAAMCMLFFFATKGGISGKIKQIFKFCIIVMVVLAVLYVFAPDILENIAKRWQAKDITEGRIDLLAMYNGYILHSAESLFFGTGLGNLSAAIDAYFLQTNTMWSHNGFQEILIVWGIPGAILCAVFLYCIVKRSRRVFPYQRLINYIPLLLLLLKVQAGQLVTSFYTLLMFMLAYLSLICDFSKKNENKEQ